MEEKENEPTEQDAEEVIAAASILQSTTPSRSSCITRWSCFREFGLEQYALSFQIYLTTQRALGLLPSPHLSMVAAATSKEDGIGAKSFACGSYDNAARVPLDMKVRKCIDPTKCIRHPTIVSLGKQIENGEKDKAEELWILSYMCLNDHEDQSSHREVRLTYILLRSSC